MRVRANTGSEPWVVAWSIPLGSSPQGVLGARGKVGGVAQTDGGAGVYVGLLALCSPGASVFSPGRLTHFCATAETRCVRDLKRAFSWKVYGLACGAGRAHYVRLQFRSPGSPPPRASPSPPYRVPPARLTNAVREQRALRPPGGAAGRNRG